MKSLLTKLQWSEISLPVVAILAAAVVLLPASQLAVLGLLRVTQKSAGQSMVQAPRAADHDPLLDGHLLSGAEIGVQAAISEELHIDPLLAMAAAMNRERRVGERLSSPSASPTGGSAHRGHPAAGQTPFQGPDAAFSAALSSVFADTSKATRSAVPAAKIKDTKPFAIEFVSLPLHSASALVPVFALAPGAVNGEAWAQMHPDLADQPSVAILQVTLSRALGR
jgi:hypothetical protein